MSTVTSVNMVSKGGLLAPSLFLRLNRHCGSQVFGIKNNLVILHWVTVFWVIEFCRRLLQLECEMSPAGSCVWTPSAPGKARTMAYLTEVSCWGWALKMAQLWFQLSSLVSICQDVRGYTMLPLPGPSYSNTPPPPQGTVFLRPGAKINLSFSKIFFWQIFCSWPWEK